MNTLGRILRILAIIFMGLTAVMNLLGGAGTTCAAFFTEKYPSLMELFDYRWLYQAFVILTIAVGVAGIWATVELVRGREKAYRNALIVLVIGVVINGIHYYASNSLRGNAAPANVIFYLNLITLILFLVVRIPGIRDHVKFTKVKDTDDGSLAAGAAAIVSGVVTLTTMNWVGSTHVYQGGNWVNELIVPLVVAGVGLLLLGCGLLASVLYNRFLAKGPRVRGEFLQTRIE